MTKRATTPGDRVPLLITVGVFVVMLACLPLVWMLDADLDEDRSMYEDMLRMQTYQAEHIANDGSPVETTVSDGESVKVGAGVHRVAGGHHRRTSNRQGLVLRQREQRPG